MPERAYTSIRLTADQASAFSEYRDGLHARVKACPARYPHWLNVPNLSIATAMEFLLCQHIDHMDRGRKARRRRATVVETPRPGG